MSAKLAETAQNSKLKYVFIHEKCFRLMDKYVRKETQMRSVSHNFPYFCREIS